MQSRFGIVVVATLFILLLAGPALAWDEAKTKAQVQEMLDNAAEAFMKKDLKTTAFHHSDDAAIKYLDGRAMTMDKWLEICATEIADWRDIRSKFIVERVYPRGKDHAGAVYTETHEFSLASDPGHRRGIWARFRVLLARTPEGWRFQEFTELNEQFTLDGKPVTPKVAPKPSRKAKPQI